MLFLAGLSCARPVARSGDSRCGPIALGEVRVERIAAWRGDARAAYSIIHDDMCAPGVEGIHEIAVPALDRRGLRAALGPIAGECERRGLWKVVARAQRHGHEIVNHSYAHERVTLDNARHEVAESKALFDRMLPEPVSFFIFPYDAFTPETVAAVAAAGHWGVRAGDRGDNDADDPPINPAEPINDLAVEFDVWPRTYSKYTLYKDADLLAAHVWAAVARGGWAVRELHSVMPDAAPPQAHGFGAVRQSVYEEHLDFLTAASGAGLVWVDTPTEILRYRHARRACRASADGARVVFDASDPECARYATPISIVIATRADLPGLRAVQRGQALPVRKLGPGSFSVTADPTWGEVALAGCASEPHVIPPPALAPPRPATSVCDVARAVSPGGVRRIDGLETSPLVRDEDDELPSWSWYPDAAQVVRARQAHGAMLRFSCTARGTWSGATLLMPAPDGDLVCHDVRAHRGVRFRIRGTVEDAGELTNQVFVSLITAQTRARMYGGDLQGDGGHFHKTLALAPEWQEVAVAWADFSAPTWGQTVGLTAPALDQVQALDFGVADAAARFEIWIDDVELY